MPVAGKHRGDLGCPPRGAKEVEQICIAKPVQIVDKRHVLMDA